MKQLTLGEIIDMLKAADQNAVLRNGFENPHSYRGYYERLCFEPVENISVKHMLACADEVHGAYFTGWKGGEFKMHLGTVVHLNYEGHCELDEFPGTDIHTDAITDDSLKAMLEDKLTDIDHLLYT